MRKKILVVDDEPSISVLIDFNLKLAGYEVLCVHDGESVFEAVDRYKPDLIVLDLMLPRMDGFQVCSALRSQGNAVPVIILTALADLSDKIAGLDYGADDYMTKPFSPRELISRIQAILRRVSASPPDTGSPSVEVGEIRIHPEEREVYVADRLIELTPKEFELLLFLARHSGKALSRQQLLQGVWDYEFIGDTRIVDVHISHLRDKIEHSPKHPAYILTVRNVGYKLTAPAARESEDIHAGSTSSRGA